MPILFTLLASNKKLVKINLHHDNNDSQQPPQQKREQQLKRS
jgi:hypothetical protein